MANIGGRFRTLLQGKMGESLANELADLMNTAFGAGGSGTVSYRAETILAGFLGRFKAREFVGLMNSAYPLSRLLGRGEILLHALVGKREATELVGIINRSYSYPTISSAATANYAENLDTTALTVVATCPLGGTITYSISGGADAALFAIGASSGAVTPISAFDFEDPEDVGGNNVYDFTVRATSSTTGNYTEQSAVVTVTDISELVDCEPTLIVTQYVAPVAPVAPVAEVFTVTGGIDEVVTFAESGTENPGDATFDAGGLVTAFTNPLNYTGGIGGIGTDTITFTANTVGARSDYSKSSGGGGTVTVTVQGVTEVIEVIEVIESFDVDFDEPDRGTITISGEEIEWDATDVEVETALNLALSPEAVTVTGADGVFTATYDSSGDKTDAEIDSHTLQKPAP
jgi:hypothetical protein